MSANSLVLFGASPTLVFSRGGYSDAAGRVKANTETLELVCKLFKGLPVFNESWCQHCMA